MEKDRTQPLSAQELQFRLNFLELAPNDLAVLMKRFGDHRGRETSMKSIRRMLTGETAVSPEIVVILELWEKLREMGGLFFPNLEWLEVTEDRYRATFENWTVHVSKVRRIWRPTITHPDGYDLAWQSYSHLETLEYAKRTAEIRLFSAIHGIDLI